MRKTLGVLLFIAVLAGCVPLRPTPNPSPLPTPSATPFPPTPTPTPPPEPLVESLTLWLPEELNPYGEGPGAEVLAEQLEAFNQHNSDLQVEVIVKKAHGRGGLLDFMRTASVVAPSVMPDLVVLDISELDVAVQAGLVQPLDDLLPTDLSRDRFPFAVLLGQVDGQTMGLPLTVELEHLAYRSTLLTSPPVTWTDVLSDGVPFLFPAAGQEGSVNDFTLVQYLAAGGRFLGEGETPQLEAAPLVAVLDFYTRAVSAGVVSPTVVLSLADADECWERYQAGQAGMTVVNSHRFWTERGDDTAPAIIPSPDGRAVSLARGRWVLTLVTQDPERREQAMRLAEWLLAPEQHGPWTQSTGYLPTMRRGLNAWAIPEEERAVLEALLEGAQLAPPPSIREVVGPPLQEAVEAVLTGQRSPSGAATAALRAVGP